MQIESIEQLKRLASTVNGGVICYIVLAGGLVKSTKHVLYYPDDDSWDCDELWEDENSSLDDAFSWEEFGKVSNVPKALEEGALFTYE